MKESNLQQLDQQLVEASPPSSPADDKNNNKDNESKSNNKFASYEQEFENEEDNVDFRTRRRIFIKEKLIEINRRTRNSSQFTRTLMIWKAKIEAKIRFRKTPYLDASQPGSIYVGDRRFGGESLYYFPANHPLRRGAIRVITDPWYMQFSTILMLFHIIPAIVAEPGVPRSRFSDSIPELWAFVILFADRFLILYFSIELGVTFVAYGFLRTCANWFRLIDVVSIVIAMCVDAIPSELNEGRVAKYFIAMNAVRIFRIVGRVEGMRKLMMVLVSCIPTLLDVGMLLSTLLFSFSIVGLTFFREAQHNRCVSNDASDIAFVCTPESYAVSDPQRCETGFNCTQDMPPSNPWGNYDNFAKALLSIIQIITLDDWYVLASEVMSGLSQYVVVYFIAGTVLGAFWSMNLILAVITDAFSRFHASEKQMKNRKKKMKRLLKSQEEKEMDRILNEGKSDNNNDENNDGGANDNNGNDGEDNNNDDEDSVYGSKSLLSAGSGKSDPLLPGGSKRRRRRNSSKRSQSSIGTYSSSSSDDDNDSFHRHFDHSLYDDYHDLDGDGPLYGASPGSANARSAVASPGTHFLNNRHTGVRGTHPWFRRKLRMWLRNLSNASTASLLAGIQSVDVRTIMDEHMDDPELRATVAQTRRGEHEDEEEMTNIEEAFAKDLEDYENDDPSINSDDGSNSDSSSSSTEDLDFLLGNTTESKRKKKTNKNNNNNNNTTRNKNTNNNNRFGSKLKKSATPPPPIKKKTAEELRKEWASMAGSKSKVGLIPNLVSSTTGNNNYNNTRSTSSPARRGSIAHRHHPHQTKDNNNNLEPESQYDATGLFDDSDLVELAAKATMSGAQQANDFNKQSNNQNNDDDQQQPQNNNNQSPRRNSVSNNTNNNPAKLRVDDSTRKQAVAQRVHTIESWTRSLPPVDELKSVPDPKPKWEISEDQMFDPLLVVPEATDTVGTKGKLFYPQVMFKHLPLFERYQLAAERANKDEIPEEQEPEDDIDLGFIDENDMSFAKVQKQLQRKKEKAKRQKEIAEQKKRKKQGGKLAEVEATGSYGAFATVDYSKLNNANKDNKNSSGEKLSFWERNVTKRYANWKMDLEEWWETVKISYETMPLPALLKMLHSSHSFQRSVTIMVIVTALFLSFNFYGAPDEFVVTLNVVCAINDIVLIVDVVLLLYFQGWFTRGQKRDKITAGTIIDILIGITSLLDLALVVPGFAVILRGIRGVRLMKLAKNFTLLHEMIAKMSKAGYYFASLLGVAGSFVLVFATIGRHSFDGWLPDVQNCYVQSYDFTCHQQPDCVFVTEAEWMDPTIVFADLQSRTFVPSSLVNVSVSDFNLYREYPQLLLNNISSPFTIYFEQITNYTCRQFQAWDSSGLPTDRLTFNSPIDAYLTIFNAITRDNFSTVMYNYMNVSPFASIMFLFILFFGSYVLVSLLISILLVHFSDLQVDNDKDDGDNDLMAIDDAKKNKNGDSSDVLPIDAEQMNAEHAAMLVIKDSVGKKDNNVAENSKTKGAFDEEEDPETWASRPAKGGVTHPPSNIAAQKVLMGDLPEHPSWQDKVRVQVSYSTRRLLLLLCDVADPLIHTENLRGSSFFMFSTDSVIRRRCCDLISGKYFPFEQTIVLTSLAQCIVTFVIGTEAADTSRSTQGELSSIATTLTMEWLLVALSVADLIVRCIAQGALLGDYSFWNSRFENKIDGCTIVLSFLAALYRLISGQVTTGIAPDLLLRSFRPMRIVIRSRGMKNVALAVFQTLPAMGRVLGLAAALIWMLSLMCVEYFGGSLRVCSDGSDRSQTECVGTYQLRALQIVEGEQLSVLVNQTRSFRNMNEYNFDNIFFSFTTLTSLAVASQWTNVVFSLIDSPEVPGGRPIRENRKWTIAVVMIWIVIGNFVLLNIFVGTIVDNFSRFKLKLAGALFKTPEEVELAQIRLMLKQTRVKKALSIPEKPWISRTLNKICFLIITSSPFLYWTRCVTLFDMASIATLHYSQSENWMVFQEAAVRAISVALWVEVFLKAGISGPLPYLKIWFNRIDFLMACVVGAESLMYIWMEGYRTDPFLHTARIISSFRLVREVKSFRSLLKSGLRALPAMSNIGSLVALVFFTCSFLAMGFFKNVRTIIYSDGGINLDYRTNFKQIPQALIAMYLVATLDNWGDVMQACSAEVPNCQAGVDCGEPALAQIFYVIYIIVVGFVMINLFITVVLENFSESVLVPAYVTERLRDVNSFRQEWVTFDPSGRQVIAASQFLELLKKLPGPRFRLARLRGDIDTGDNVSACSWASEEKEKYAAHSAVGLMGEPLAAILPTLRDIQVPITMPNQEVLFSDALDVIGEKIFHISLLDDDAQQVKDEIRRSAKEYEKGYTILHFYAASRIQNFMKTLWSRASQPPQMYKSTILWDQLLKPLFAERWKHSSESIFKKETAEEASIYRKLVRGRVGITTAGGKADDGGDKKDDDDGTESKRSGSKRRRRGASSKRRGGDSSPDGSPTKSKNGGDTGDGTDNKNQHIKPLLTFDVALGSKMAEDVEEVEEDTSWMWAVDDDVVSEGSSWADDEGEEAWLPASALSGRRNIRSVGVAPECRRLGGVFELISVEELIQRKRREREFLSNFAPTVRQRLQNMPPKSRRKFQPAPLPSASYLAELIDQNNLGGRSNLSKRQQQMEQRRLEMLSSKDGDTTGKTTTNETKKETRDTSDVAEKRQMVDALVAAGVSVADAHRRVENSPRFKNVKLDDEDDDDLLPLAAKKNNNNKDADDDLLSNNDEDGGAKPFSIAFDPDAVLLSPKEREEYDREQRKKAEEKRRKKAAEEEELLKSSGKKKIVYLSDIQSKKSGPAVSAKPMDYLLSSPSKKKAFRDPNSKNIYYDDDDDDDHSIDIDGLMMSSNNNNDVTNSNNNDGFSTATNVSSSGYSASTATTRPASYNYYPNPNNIQDYYRRMNPNSTLHHHHHANNNTSASSAASASTAGGRVDDDLIGLLLPNESNSNNKKRSSDYFENPSQYHRALPRNNNNKSNNKATAAGAAPSDDDEGRRRNRYNNNSKNNNNNNLSSSSDDDDEDFDDALRELRKQVKRDNLRHASRLTDVSQILQKRRHDKESSNANLNKTSSNNRQSSSSPPSRTGMMTATSASSANKSKNNNNQESTMSSLAGIRESVYSSSRLRNFNMNKTLDLCNSTIDAATPSFDFGGLKASQARYDHEQETLRRMKEAEEAEKEKERLKMEEIKRLVDGGGDAMMMNNTNVAAKSSSSKKDQKDKDENAKEDTSKDKQHVSFVGIGDGNEKKLTPSDLMSPGKSSDTQLHQSPFRLDVPNSPEANANNNNSKNDESPGDGEQDPKNPKKVNLLKKIATASMALNRASGKTGSKASSNAEHERKDE